LVLSAGAAREVKARRGGRAETIAKIVFVS
jgi:hypothetical protein